MLIAIIFYLVFGFIYSGYYFKKEDHTMDDLLDLIFILFVVIFCIPIFFFNLGVWIKTPSKDDHR